MTRALRLWLVLTPFAALALGCANDPPPKAPAPTGSSVSSEAAGAVPAKAEPSTEPKPEPASTQATSNDAPQKPAAPKGDDSAAPAGETEKKEPATRPSLLSREQIDEGWIALFDGHSLFGWKPNSDANWSVADGVITADSGKPGMLMTTVRFADYELTCDYRLEAGGNSGIFLRTLFEPKNPGKDCYELNMCDTHPAFGTASLVARVKPEEAVTGEDGKWHTLRARCEGTKISVTFDGKPVLDFDDTTENVRREGLIGLQMNGKKIEFRNVFLRPLGEKDLFNGKDLTGWRVVPGSKSTFDVKDGAIHVENGGGFLETEGTWANFVLQGQARTNGDRLNSGVFFRALPGTEAAPSNGYEFQIQNGFEKDDREKPADFGTGAIYRRVKARYVVPNDREWFTFTLVADGDNFASWVDGYPVMTWTDTRDANENPRNGKRLGAGHFSLQGHDPTTNLDFKSLRVVELP